MIGLDSAGGRHVPGVELRLGGFWLAVVVVDGGWVVRSAVVVVAVGVWEGVGVLGVLAVGCRGAAHVARRRVFGSRRLWCPHVSVWICWIVMAWCGGGGI